MKRRGICFVVLIVIALFYTIGCTNNAGVKEEEVKNEATVTASNFPKTETPSTEPTIEGSSAPAQSQQDTSDNVAEYSYFDEEGTTIADRILPPQGYQRTSGNEYEEFIRNQELLPHDSPVLLYNGNEKSRQDVHVAVLKIDVGEKDLQQCADAALRLRCEFLFSTGQFDRINYHLTNGDTFSYSKFREGYRLRVDGNNTSMRKTASYDDSYETFRNYCDTLFAYAGTMSIENESESITKEEMRIGDIFVKGGSPGHCVIVMDMCENEAGDKMFLIGQSYMPAQQIHILKNPSSDSPWYSLNDLTYPFQTPEWSFESECLKRMP